MMVNIFFSSKSINEKGIPHYTFWDWTTIEPEFIKKKLKKNVECYELFFFFHETFALTLPVFNSKVHVRQKKYIFITTVL